MNKGSDAELIGRLYAVQDIIAAAEAQFAETDDHHRYYGDCFNAVDAAIRALTRVEDTE